jgi:hypothetical protein
LTEDDTALENIIFVGNALDSRAFPTKIMFSSAVSSSVKMLVSSDHGG